MTLRGEHPGFEQLSAFLDGELSAEETRELERHLAECHSCALRIVSASRLKAATGHAFSGFTPSSGALARLAGQLRAPAQKKPEQFLPGRALPWAAIAACLIAVALLLGWWRARPSGTLTAELLDQHLAVLASGSTPEVVSSDRHTVKPWFQGKLPFSFNLPDPLPAGATLKGADLTYLHGQPAALLLFTMGKHQVSVFLTQRLSDTVLPASTATQSGFLIRSGDTQELHILAVSDVNSADLAVLVTSLANAQSPH